MEEFYRMLNQFSISNHPIKNIMKIWKMWWEEKIHSFPLEKERHNITRRNSSFLVKISSSMQSLLAHEFNRKPHHFHRPSCINCSHADLCILIIRDPQECLHQSIPFLAICQRHFFPYLQFKDMTYPYNNEHQINILHPTDLMTEHLRHR